MLLHILPYLPLIIYNIPGRTGRLIDVKTLLELAKIDNIIGVKDAAANINQTMALLAGIRRMSKKFYVLCGEDALTFSSLCLGGDGAIAAVAHVIGKELQEMMQAFARGDYKAAQDVHFRTLDIVNAPCSITWKRGSALPRSCSTPASRSASE